MINVREATIEDQTGIARVEADAIATLRQVYRPNARALANRSRMQQNLSCLVAEVEGRIVGTVEYALEGGALRVVNLGVRNDSRRKGVARALIESLAEIGQTSMIPCLLLHTVKETGNVTIFQRLGFQVVVESEDDYSESNSGAPLTDVELRRHIKAAGGS